MLVTDEQQQIVDAIRDFAQERLRPFAEQWDKAHRFPREAIDEMAALGLFGMLVPEQYGGSDTGYVMPWPWKRSPQATVPARPS